MTREDATHTEWGEPPLNRETPAGQAGPETGSRGRAEELVGRFAPWPCCKHCTHPRGQRSFAHFAPCDHEECLRPMVEDRIYAPDPLDDVPSTRLLRAALHVDELETIAALLKDGLRTVQAPGILPSHLIDERRTLISIFERAVAEAREAERDDRDDQEDA